MKRILKMKTGTALIFMIQLVLADKALADGMPIVKGSWGNLAESNSESIEIFIFFQDDIRNRKKFPCSRRLF